MAKQVFVTGAQVAAAKAIVKRDAAKGRTTRTAVKRIASAASQRSLDPATDATR